MTTETVFNSEAKLAQTKMPMKCELCQGSLSQQMPIVDGGFLVLIHYCYNCGLYYYKFISIP